MSLLQEEKHPSFKNLICHQLIIKFLETSFWLEKNIKSIDFLIKNVRILKHFANFILYKMYIKESRFMSFSKNIWAQMFWSISSTGQCTSTRKFISILEQFSEVKLCTSHLYMPFHATKNVYKCTYYTFYTLLQFKVTMKGFRQCFHFQTILISIL